MQNLNNKHPFGLVSRPEPNSLYFKELEHSIPIQSIKPHILFATQNEKHLIYISWYYVIQIGIHEVNPSKLYSFYF